MGTLARPVFAPLAFSLLGCTETKGGRAGVPILRRVAADAREQGHFTQGWLLADLCHRPGDVQLQTGFHGDGLLRRDIARRAVGAGGHP